MSDAPDSASFNKNYKVLKETADWLSQQREPDIDQLVPKVEQAMQAYKLCKMRLDAVQATLASYFEPEGSTPTEDVKSSGATGKAAAGRNGSSATLASDDEDTPF